MNKVALITGGARRIGAETANYLHSKGINIVITYSKSSVAANALKKELNLKRKGSCHIYKAKFNSNINLNENYIDNSVTQPLLKNHADTRTTNTN